MKYLSYVLVAILFLGIGYIAPHVTSGNPELGGSETITFTNPVIINESYDGYMIGGKVTPSSTSTITTLYTHKGRKALCNATQGGLFADSLSTPSASLQVSVGTSTSAVYSKTLVASTTMATSTDTFAKPTASMFVLSYGDVITLSLGDNVTNASSTYLSAWTIYFQAHCWTI